MFGFTVEPIIEVMSRPVPISLIKSSRDLSDWVSERFERLGDGGAEVPRDAFDVLCMSSLRALARSSVHPVKTPSSMIARRCVAKPSASNMRDEKARGRRGSSIREIPVGKTCSPSASRNQLDPRAIAAPFTAWLMCPTRLLEMRSSNRTGNVPVFGLRAPARSTARAAALRPMSSASRMSAWKIRLS